MSGLSRVWFTYSWLTSLKQHMDLKILRSEFFEWWSGFFVNEVRNSSYLSHITSRTSCLKAPSASLLFLTALQWLGTHFSFIILTFRTFHSLLRSSTYRAAAIKQSAWILSLKRSIMSSLPTFVRSNLCGVCSEGTLVGHHKISLLIWFHLRFSNFL